MTTILGGSPHITQPKPGSYRFERTVAAIDVAIVKAEAEAMLGLLLHQHLSDGRQYVVKASGWEETPVPIYELGTAQGTVSWGEEPEAVGQRFLLQYSYYILLLNPSVAKVGESVLLAEGSRNLPSDEFPCIGNRVAIAGGIFSCQIAQASVGDDTYSIYERIS